MNSHAATDHYVNKCLPINIETQIYKQVSKVATPQSRPILVQYTAAMISKLAQMMEDENLKFNKSEVRFPDLKIPNFNFPIKKPP